MNKPKMGLHIFVVGPKTAMQHLMGLGLRFPPRGPNPSLRS